MKQSLGEFICTLRKAQGYTQADVAEKLNISNRTLSSWETDRTAPDIAVLPALADLYGVTVDEILRCERAPKNAEEIPLSKSAEYSMRKNRFAKFCEKRILCLGLGLAGSILFIVACALLIYTFCPLWLNILIMIIGAGGNVACIVLLAYFYRCTLRSEGIVFDTDCTEDKKAFTVTLRHTFASSLIINSLPYIVWAIVFFSIELARSTSFTIGNLTVSIGFSTPAVTLIVSNFAVGIIMLAFGLIYNRLGINEFGNEKQIGVLAHNRKLAIKVYGIGAIVICILFIGVIIFLAVPIRVEQIQFSCNEYNELVAHMHTLVIDDNNDNNGKIPHGSYLLNFPTEITPDVEDEWKNSHDLGNGFTGSYNKVTFRSSGNNTSGEYVEWRLFYEENYYCHIPALSLESDGTARYLAAVPYMDKSSDYFCENQADEHFEIKTDDGFKIIYITTLSNVKGATAAAAIGSALTCIVVCTILYFSKRKKMEYKF